MRYPYSSQTKDANGRLITGAIVNVFLTGTTTPASVYIASSGGTAVNSVTSDANGKILFYVDHADYPGYPTNQRFDLTITKSTTQNVVYASLTMVGIAPFPNDSPGYEYDAAEYGDGTFTEATINTCLTVMGTSTKGTILLRPGTWVVAPYTEEASLIFPANVTLKMPAGAILSIPTGRAPVISGHFEAGAYQVFSCAGTGAVGFGTGSGIKRELLSIWWDGVVNAHPAIAPQGTPTAKTTAATLTIAELLTGIITGTHAAGATQAYTLPIGTLCDAGGIFSINYAFDWSLINLSAAAVDTITVTASSGHTIVGNPIVQSAHSSTGGIYGNSGRFRTRKTAASTFVTYRIA